MLIVYLLGIIEEDFVLGLHLEENKKYFGTDFEWVWIKNNWMLPDCTVHTQSLFDTHPWCPGCLGEDSTKIENNSKYEVLAIAIA